MALDGSSPLVYFATGLVELFSEEHEKSVIAIEKALALDNNYADAYALLGWALTFAGRPEAALEPMKKAMRLSPHQPLAYLSILGMAYFSLGRYEMAVNLFKKALARNPTAQNARMWLAATYAKLGRIEDAEWEAQELLSSNPKFSLKRISHALPFKDPAQLEVLLDGLRKAGLPD
jgi:adenylate cyclase